MNTLGFVILVIGLITTLIGGIRFIIVAFEEGFWWGIAVLFFPIVSPVFLILRFGDAWRPALNFVIGFALVLLGSLLRGVAQA